MWLLWSLLLQSSSWDFCQIHFDFVCVHIFSAFHFDFFLLESFKDDGILPTWKRIDTPAMIEFWFFWIVYFLFVYARWCVYFQVVCSLQLWGEPFNLLCHFLFSSIACESCEALQIWYNETDSSEDNLLYWALLNEFLIFASCVGFLWCLVVWVITYFESERKRVAMRLYKSDIMRLTLFWGQPLVLSFSLSFTDIMTCCLFCYIELNCIYIFFAGNFWQRAKLTRREWCSDVCAAWVRECPSRSTTFLLFLRRWVIINRLALDWIASRTPLSRYGEWRSCEMERKCICSTRGYIPNSMLATWVHSHIIETHLSTHEQITTGNLFCSVIFVAVSLSLFVVLIKTLLTQFFRHEEKNRISRFF